MRKQKINRICLTGVLSALVFVVTAYLHIPTGNGYIHVGDGLISFAACILPAPYAMAVGAGGAALADCLSGFAIWAPGSALIKALSALLFSSKGRRVLTLRNIPALLPAALLCAGGYYLYEAILYGNLIAPLGGIVASLVQSGASAILFLAIGLSFDKMDGKRKLDGGNRL